MGKADKMSGGAMKTSAIAAACAFAFLAGCATSGVPEGPKAMDAAEKPIPKDPVFRLTQILGAAPERVDVLLGAPDLTRREGAGEYRRYTLSRCALIVILYPDNSGRVRAAHVDATALRSGQDKPDVDDCLAAG